MGQILIPRLEVQQGVQQGAPSRRVLLRGANFEFVPLPIAILLYNPAGKHVLAVSRNPFLGEQNMVSAETAPTNLTITNPMNNPAVAEVNLEDGLQQLRDGFTNGQERGRLPSGNETLLGKSPIGISLGQSFINGSLIISQTVNHFFPRASERRVLPIVGVCISSSHLHTFSSSHLLIFTPSHLHTFSSSHLLIFTSAHLHICSSHLLITSAHLHIFSSSHLLIFTPAHLHICSSSHLLIFTSAHLHICSSSHLLSHLLIFTSAHLHICSSSHLLIFTSAHLHICSSSHLLIFTSAHLHICSSSHLLIFTSAHLHICSSSHLLIFTSAHLHIFSLSFLSPFSLSRLLYLSLFRPRVVPAVSHETSTLSHEMRVDRQKLR